MAGKTNMFGRPNNEMTRQERETFYARQQSYYREMAENEARMTLYRWFPSRPLVASFGSDPAVWRNMWYGEQHAQTALSYAARVDTGLIYMSDGDYNVETGALIAPRVARPLATAPKTVYRGMRL